MQPCEYGSRRIGVSNDNRDMRFSAVGGTESRHGCDLGAGQWNIDFNKGVEQIFASVLELTDVVGVDD